jgi:hypothetical protein
MLKKNDELIKREKIWSQGCEGEKTQEGGVELWFLFLSPKTEFTLQNLIAASEVIIRV